MLDSGAKSTSRDRKIYYGWVVVATSFVAFTVAFAIQFSFGVFFKPLQDTFGWSRAATSLAMTVHLIVFASCIVPISWTLGRFSTRTLYSIAACVTGSSLILCSFVSQPWQLYLLYGLPLGMGLSIYGAPSVALVTPWFTEKRGIALGIATGGTGFGALVGAPLSNSLIAAYGWRSAFLILGIAGSIILLVCAYFLRKAPRPPDNQNKSSPNRSGNGSKSSQPAPLHEMTFRQAIKTREIRLIMVAQVFTLFTLRMVIVHIAPYATDIGISPSVAALAIGTIGGFSILGRLGMGFVQDRIGPQRSMMICLSTQAVTMLALPFIGSDWLFFTYAVVFGLTYGGDIPQMPAITAQCFGVASIALIYGLVMSVAAFSGAIGPLAAGYVFDLTGSYAIIFLGAAIGLFVAAFCISRLKLRD